MPIIPLVPAEELSYERIHGSVVEQSVRWRLLRARPAAHPFKNRRQPGGGLQNRLVPQRHCRVVPAGSARLIRAIKQQLEHDSALAEQLLCASVPEIVMLKRRFAPCEIRHIYKHRVNLTGRGNEKRCLTIITKDPAGTEKALLSVAKSGVMAVQYWDPGTTSEGADTTSCG